MKETRCSSGIKFVGLHAHSVAGSPFDALGYPPEHMDYAYQNGCDALALTDHGNANGLPYQVLHAKKMEKEGKDFKPIYGSEVYFIESIEDWKQEVKELKEKEKVKDEEEASGATIEDEDEGKNDFKDALKRRSHLLLLAQNQVGLNNIFKLVSESYKGDNFYRYPRVDYKLLEKYNEGIIATSACIGGILGRVVWENKTETEDFLYNKICETITKMLAIFGKDRFYGELQWNNIPEQHKLNQLILRASKEHGLKVITTVDSHYPTPQSWKDREIYKRLGVISRASRPDWFYKEIPDSINEIGYELYPKNGDQVWESYKRFSKIVGVSYDDEAIRETIERTYDIAHNQISRFYPDNKVRLPNFVVPEGKTEDGHLSTLAILGLKERKLHTKPQYVARLKSELYVIQDRGFSKYFLTMKAISDKAQETQLVGAGRGSGAGSLVSYVLGITQVDPIKWDLQFERFLRRDATDYPDIDFDTSSPMELKDQFIKEWGEDKVAPISNWNTLQLKSLIKDISKLYDIPWKEVNDVTNIMVKEATGPAKKANNIKSGMYIPTYEEVLEYSTSLQDFLERYPFIGDHVKKLHGQIRSCSRHAGGLVVGEELDKYMPLINSGGVRQTPWSEGQNVRHLEPMGFIKFDILGLASLRMIDTCIRHIYKRFLNTENPTFNQVKDFYNSRLHPDILNFDDQKVYENIFHQGKWAGIFQFSEQGSQSFCKRSRPKSLIDLAVITSIYRPGPLGESVDQKYIAAKENPEDIDYISDHFKEVTEETSGFLVFQEQISTLAHKLGKDISLDEGNTLRKLLIKKGIGEVEEKKNKIHSKFMLGCEEKGISSKMAQSIWDSFEYFSAYGFNKAHAVSYSIISYQCAYLATYYPSEWMAAFLDKEVGDKKEKAINIARAHGFKIQSLDVNKSGKVWEIDVNDDKVLIQPLSSILGVGEVAIDQILLHRPFKSLEDFFFHDTMLYSKVNKKCNDALIKTGALDALIEDHLYIRHRGHLWNILCNGPKPTSLKKFNEKVEEFENESDFSNEEKIEHLVSLSGVFPMYLVVKDEIKDRLSQRLIPPISEYDSDLGVVWFVPREVLLKKTKNKKDYFIVKVLDVNSVNESIKCWGIDVEKDKVYLNRPYMAKLEYDEQWGFSCRGGVRKNFRLLG